MDNCIILEKFNGVFTLFGLPLPIKGHADRYSSTNKSKKAIGIVLFFIVCLSFLSLNGICHLNVDEDIPFKVTVNYIFFILKTGLSISVVGMRAIKHEELQKFFSILSIKLSQTNDCLPHRRGIQKIVIRNLFLTLKIVTLGVITSYKIYLLYKAYKIYAIYYVLEILLYMLLIFECWITAVVLKVMKAVAEGVKETAIEVYGDFYRVPPANLKKTGNGDFVLVGWITEALNSRSDKQNILLLKNLTYFIVQFKDGIQIFNDVFGVSILALIAYVIILFADICISFNIVEGCDRLAYADVARMMLLTVCRRN